MTSSTLLTITPQPTSAKPAAAALPPVSKSTAEPLLYTLQAIEHSSTNVTSLDDLHSRDKAIVQCLNILSNANELPDCLYTQRNPTALEIYYTDIDGDGGFMQLWKEAIDDPEDIQLYSSTRRQLLTDALAEFQELDTLLRSSR